MAKQVVNIGTVANDNTGDSLRVGGDKINDNFDELYGSLGNDLDFTGTMTTALAGKQPLDSDLTAIAALATTSFGRALLTLADAAAGLTAFGVGTLGTQAASAVAITGGTIAGLTSLQKALETPASASATGVQGQIAWDADYVYICTATNTWKRVAIATW